jgi:hypothetical protein
MTQGEMEAEIASLRALEDARRAIWRNISMGAGICGLMVGFSGVG